MQIIKTVNTFWLFKDYLDIISEQNNLSIKANIKFQSGRNHIHFRFNKSVIDGLNQIHKDLVFIASSLAFIADDLVWKLKERKKLFRIDETPLEDELLLRNTRVWYRRQ